MEIANLGRVAIRQATPADAGRISRLAQSARFSHSHADWHLLVDWLGTPGFVVAEMEDRGRHTLVACLAVGADPLPAAWVRLAALGDIAEPDATLAAMLGRVLPYLRDSGVMQLGWLAAEPWPDRWLGGLGFAVADRIVTYVKEDCRPQELSGEGVEVRPARLEHMPLLAQIEAAAFEPLWRHSAAGLARVIPHALSFDVALLDGLLAGFQYSVANLQAGSAHLVRITVSPAARQRGVGSALMAAALAGYGRQGIQRASLNTQVSNLASHRLYERFGFSRTGEQIPVWVMTPDGGL